MEKGTERGQELGLRRAGIYNPYTVGQWEELTGTAISNVDPCPANNCSYSANEGQDAVTDNWNSAAYDSRRDQLILFGGGHGGYAGNEHYGIDLLNKTVSRLRDPTTTVTEGVAFYTDGNPSSWHTYNNVVYSPQQDRVFYLGQTFVYQYSNPPSFNNVVGLDLSDNTWDADGTWTDGSYLGGSAVSAIDADGVIWVYRYEGGVGNYLSSFDPSSDSWTDYTANAQDAFDYYNTAAIDTSRNEMASIGSGTTQGVVLHDLDNPGNAPTFPSTSGAAGGLALEDDQAPGFIYDPIGDRYIGWNGGQSLYALDPDTWEWSALTVGGDTPGNANTNGTFGRFAYCPRLHAVIVVNSSTTNAFVFRLD